MDLGTPALSRPTGYRDLGLHTGVIGEGYVDLVESGALTNACKSLDPGVRVTNTAFSDRRLRNLIVRDARLRFAPVAYTHNSGVLARQRRMVAINNVLEADLHGRVNAERIEGRRVSGIRWPVSVQPGRDSCAEGTVNPRLASERPIGRSRIRARLDHITLERGDVDVVITEHGAALLRGLDRGVRARVLIALADPSHWEALMRAWEEGERDHEL